MVLRQSGWRRVWYFEMEVGVLEVNERLFFFKIYSWVWFLVMQLVMQIYLFFFGSLKVVKNRHPLKNQKDLERRGSQRPSKFNADDFYSFFIFTYCKSSEKSIWNQRNICHKINTSRLSNTFNVWRCTLLSPTKSRPADHPNLAAAQQNQLRPKNRTRCSLCSPCFALHHGRS